MIVFKQEIREIRAIVRDLLGDRAPTRWQGLAQVEYMVRRMPDDLSPAQVAGLYALQGCEFFYVWDECPDVIPEPGAIEALRDKAQEDLLSFAGYLPSPEAQRVRSIAKLFEESSECPAETQRVAEGRQLFDLLQKPQPLNWLEVALIREGTRAGRTFEQRYGVPVEAALRILFAWESAQSSEWDRGLLADFFDPEIFPDRRLVHLRIDAAMPERFAPEVGLQWLERERIPVGDLLGWVRENLRTQAVSEPQATPPSTPENQTLPIAADVSNWKMQVQAAAAEIWLDWRNRSCNPTVHSIVNEVARWCVDNDIRTDSGINPTAGYLRTHVLSGQHWTPPR